MELRVKTNKREQAIDITHLIDEKVKESNVKSGLCVVYCPHTTAAITINENADPDVKHDIIMKLHKLIPQDEGYAHSEGNSDAHIKSSLVGCSETIIVENGRLKLGTWQGIMFAEFDGPRDRRVVVKVVGA